MRYGYLEDWDEDVRVVVGTFVLNDRDQSLEAHATIDVFGRKGPQGAVLKHKFKQSISDRKQFRTKIKIQLYSLFFN